MNVWCVKDLVEVLIEVKVGVEVVVVLGCNVLIVEYY